MRPLDFERLRPGRPGCPSDLALHRLGARELEGEAAQTLRGHVNGCAACAARVARNAAGFSAWPEADPVRMLAAIRRGADERAGGAAQRWLSLSRFALAPLALAATVGVMVVALPEEGGPSTRLKGGPILHVFRERDGAAVEALSGDRFTPGEPLQLTVDLPAGGRVGVVGVEGDGDLYPIWPREEGAPFAPMEAGAGQRIPGAFALDELPGSETFHLVLCPPQAGASPVACRSQGPGRPPACPAGCVSSPFLVRKGE